MFAGEISGWTPRFDSNTDYVHVGELWALHKCYWSSFRLRIWSQQHQTFPDSEGLCGSSLFHRDPRPSLVTVDLVAFYGSIVLASFNDKELLIQVGPVFSLVYTSALILHHSDLCHHENCAFGCLCHSAIPCINTSEQCDFNACIFHIYISWLFGHRKSLWLNQSISCFDWSQQTGRQTTKTFKSQRLNM